MVGDAAFLITEQNTEGGVCPDEITKRINLHVSCALHPVDFMAFLSFNSYLNFWVDHFRV